ncbi:MAG: DNA translocase FtsK 4TM domain-containing protein [Candidatus Pacebacteria bacterium]|jgi:S-DNA-T family DNA segregation ATPase FtsK/SpoIIIE|nr:DNA translocase FtsK 4TM domain-containing protein [Candidatus Paceibacterota bacterium]
MAKKKEVKDFSLKSEIGKDTTKAIVAILFFAAALVTVLASVNKAGYVGTHIYSFFKYLFGIGYFLFPLLLIMLGVYSLTDTEQKLRVSKIVSAFLFFISGLGIINIFPGHNGGVVGNLISSPLIRLFDVYATVAILIAVLIISILVLFEAHFTQESLAFWNWFKKEKKEIDEDEIDEQVEKVREQIEEQEVEEEMVKPALKVRTPEFVEDKDFEPAPTFSRSGKTYEPPPLTLLERDKGKPEVGDIKANANIIKRTLLNFGIDVEMDEISIGPSVTRYALKPAEGVKLAKIVALNNDLALALAAHPIRIEAPIPGKSLVGIEIPNTTKTMVGLASLLSSDEYQDSPKPLMISLGKGISGKPVFANLAKAPHMLIAGTTGSGKSVTIHTLITSLLYRNSPEDLKFIFIDPKRVELTLYNKIPHLLTPVITDAKKAILALRWAAKEMSRRYDVLEQNKCRDIESFHKSRSKDSETMPYMVIIIDELADIMQTYPRELESAIVRLAQMSRAVGIHLILSTQRPSVNVITGLIKANIPTRLALQVSSQIDSRTILDAPGAEKLLGAGDTLYQGGEMSKPIRLQSAYVSEAELKDVVNYLIDSYKDEIMDEINLTAPELPGSNSMFESSIGGDELGEEDDMYEDARAVVAEAGKASTSYLQRKLGIGYSRAARLMDMLEQKGVIGPANGSKPREVIGNEAISAPADEPAQ